MTQRFNPNDFADAIEAGQMLKTYYAPGGRRAELEPGVFEVSGKLLGQVQRTNWQIPPGSILDCHERTILRSKATNVGDGCCFQVNDGVEILRAHLEAAKLGDPIFSEIVGGLPRGYPHICVVGIAGQRPYTNLKVRLYRTPISGGNFGFYVWDGFCINSQFLLEEVPIDNPRWAVTNGNSGGQNILITLKNCSIRGNYSEGWSDPVDAQGSRMHALSCRGSTIRMYGPESLIDLTGANNCGDCRGAWTPVATSPTGRQPDYEGGAPDAFIDLIDVAIRVRGNGASNVKATEQGTGLILANGGSQVAR